jgi:hypothetical protein
MSQWGTDTKEQPLQANLEEPSPTRRIPGWTRLLPFFLSAVFFVTGFLAVFSPLPILFVHLRQGRKWAWLAALTNGILVGFAGGGFHLAFYFIFAGILGLCLPEFLDKKFSIEKSAVFSMAAMGLGLVLFFSVYSVVFHVNPIHEVKQWFDVFVDFLNTRFPKFLGITQPEDLVIVKRSLMIELPSAIAIFCLTLVWANLVLVLKANPNRLREKLGLEGVFLKKWKTPEFLVWPTIASGFFLVVNVPVVSDIALNIFKFLMAIYAIQGLSILGFLFDIWGIKGIFRMIGYSISIFLMLPLILSLGFFDLWFDFRSKFRQS